MLKVLTAFIVISFGSHAALAQQKIVQPSVPVNGDLRGPPVFGNKLLTRAFIDRTFPEPVLDFGLTEGSDGQAIWILVARGTKIIQFDLVNNEVPKGTNASYGGYAIAMRSVMTSYIDKMGEESPFFNSPPYWHVNSEISVNHNAWTMGSEQSLKGKAPDLSLNSGRLVKIGSISADFADEGSGGRSSLIQIFDANGALLDHQKQLTIASTASDAVAETKQRCDAAGAAARTSTENEIEGSFAVFFERLSVDNWLTKGLAGIAGGFVGTEVGYPKLGSVAGVGVVNAQAWLTEQKIKGLKAVAGSLSHLNAEKECLDAAAAPKEWYPTIYDLAGNDGLELPPGDEFPALSCVAWSQGYETGVENDEGGYDITWHSPTCIRIEVVWVPIGI